MLQLVYVVPIYRWLKRHSRDSTVKGLAIAAAVTALLNADGWAWYGCLRNGHPRMSKPYDAKVCGWRRVMQMVFRLLVNARALLLCFMLFSIATGSSVNQVKHSYRPEQRNFSAEDSAVKRPVEIPPEVLALLEKDETVQSVMENEEPPVDKLPPSWFSASAIHLSTAKRADLVVVGASPVSGGNVALFWVFRATDHGYELVMAAPAHNLAVKNTRWKGYRDIELTSSSAVQFSTVWLRFNGKQYVKYKVKSEMIR